MSAPDDLQKLWREQNRTGEDPAMWKALFEEKRMGWNEVVRAEDQAFYLVALCFVPLTAWAAWKARYPWVHVGYGLMAATLVVSTIGTWIGGRDSTPPSDRNLREHLEALLASYQTRSRLIRRGGALVMAALTAGLAAVVLGIPGNAANPLAWLIAAIAVAGANLLQWLSYKRWAARISRKRAETERLLESLLSSGHDSR